MRRLTQLLLLIAMLAVAAVAGPGTVSLRVTVRDQFATPLAGLRVTIVETADNRFSALRTSDADGRVSVTVPPGVYQITAYPVAGGSLLTGIVYGQTITSDTSLDVVLREGIVVETAVVDAEGRGLAGARVNVSNDVGDPIAAALADETGWLRFVVPADGSVRVTPPEGSGREIGLWMRASELAFDQTGAALPIELAALPEPVALDQNLTLIYRGESTGPHLTVVFVAEGFTDLQEQYEDTNGNGRCDNEPYLDRNGNGRYDSADIYVDENRNAKRDREPFTDVNGDDVCNRGERELFLRAATDEARTLLGTPLYRDFRDSLEIVALFVPSSQAGSDFLTIPIPFERDTAFGSYVLTTSFYYYLDDDAVLAAARSAVPEVDVTAVIVNDLFGVGRAYGGDLVHLFADRRYDLSTALAHEIGHVLASLGDEYFEYDGAPPYDGADPRASNLTNGASLSNLKWGRFLRGAAIPTRDGTPGIGAFEGGMQRRHGVYRPSFNCLMRNTSAVFCAVCYETMLQAISSSLQQPRPATPTIALPRPGDSFESAIPVAVRCSDLGEVVSTQLMVDGSPVGAASSLGAPGMVCPISALTIGDHELSVEVLLSDGRRQRTDPVRVRYVGHDDPTPVLGTAEYRSGVLHLTGAQSLIVPGAVLLVDGTDRFPLVASATGGYEVPKKAFGSTSRKRFGKAVKPGRQVTLSVRNARGPVSAGVSFRR